MITALTFAAKSGVDVKIIVPHIPDKKYVNILAWNYYIELIKYGVEIYEYMPGFIHAKNVVSDDETAVVGTINMDYRSFYLHFECAAVMYKTSAVTDVKLDFLNTLAKSRMITMKDCTKRSVFKKIAGAFLRLVAPTKAEPSICFRDEGRVISSSFTQFKNAELSIFSKALSSPNSMLDKRTALAKADEPMCVTPLGIII
jgi:hypothetical protein